MAFRKILAPVFLGVCFAMASGVLLAQSTEEPLSADQQTILKEVSAEGTSQIIALVTQVDELRSGIDGAVELIDDAESAIDEISRGTRSLKDLDALFDLFELIDSSLGEQNTLREQAPPMEKLYQVVHSARREIDDLKSRWKALRDRGRSELEGQHGELRSLIEELKARVDDVVEELNKTLAIVRAPAAFARQFLEDELTKRYMNQPYEFGDDLSLRFVKHTPTKSIFAEDGGVDIIVDYGPYVQVRGSGAYFKYEPGKFPVPVLDKVRWEAPSEDQLASVGASLLSGAFSNVGVTGVALDKTSNPPKVNVAIDVGSVLAFYDGLVLKGSMTISADGKVELHKLTGGVNGSGSPLVPLGPYAAIYEITGSVTDGEDKSLAVGMKVANPAATPETMYAQTTLTLPMPFKPDDGIVVEARQFIVGLNEVAIFKGVFSSNGLSGQLLIPGPGGLPVIAKVIYVDAQFDLGKDGLTAEGVAKMFSVINTNIDLALRFDASGHLNALTTAKIGGFNAEQSVNAQFETGFSNLKFRSTFSAEVDLEIVTADATIAVIAEIPNIGTLPTTFKVSASALGETVTFNLSDLKDLTPERVAKELLTKLKDMLQNIANAAGKWSKDKQELLAKWDEHWRETLSDEAKKAGLDRIKTGNAQLDTYLGEVSEQLKDRGKWASQTWKDAGGDVSDFIKDPGESLKNLPSHVGQSLASSVRVNFSPDKLREAIKNSGDLTQVKTVLEAFDKAVPGGLGNVGGALGDLLGGITGGIFGGGGDDDDDEAKKKKREAERQLIAAVRHLRVEEQLQPLVVELANIELEQEVLWNGQFIKWRITLSDVAAVSTSLPEAEKPCGGQIGFSVRAVVIRGGVSQTSAEEAVIAAGSVDVTQLFDPSGSPALAKSEIDGLTFGDGLDLTPFLVDAVNRAVEGAISGIKVRGPRLHYQNRLAINNLSDLPLAVKVRVRCWLSSEKKWDWRDYDFEIPASAQSFLLRESGDRRPNDVGAPIRGRKVTLAAANSSDAWPSSGVEAWLVPENAELGGLRAFLGEEDGIVTLSVGEPPESRRERELRKKFEELVEIDKIAERLHGMRRRRSVTISSSENSRGEWEVKSLNTALNFGAPTIELVGDLAELRIPITVEAEGATSINGKISERSPATLTGTTSSTAIVRLPDPASRAAIAELTFTEPLGRHGQLDCHSIARQVILQLLRRSKLTVSPQELHFHTQRSLSLVNLTGKDVVLEVRFATVDESGDDYVWHDIEQSPWISMQLSADADTPQLFEHSATFGGNGRRVAPRGYCAQIREAHSDVIQDITLVEEAANLGGERFYEAEREETHVHSLFSPQAARVAKVIYYRAGTTYVEHSGRGVKDFELAIDEKPGVDGIVSAMAITGDGIDDRWSAELPPEGADRSAHIQLLPEDPSENGSYSVRLGYASSSIPWTPHYRIMLTDRWRVSGWALIENSTSQDWRYTQLLLRTGQPSSGELRDDWHTFDAGPISIHSGRKALVPMSRFAPLPLDASDILTFVDAKGESHPRSYIQLTSTSDALDVVPRGALAVYDGDGYRFSGEMPDLPPDGGSYRVPYPDKLNRKITINRKSDHDVAQAASIVKECLRFTVSTSEHSYEVTNATGNAADVHFEFAEDEKHSAISTVVTLTASDPPAAVFAAVQQPLRQPLQYAVNLRNCNLHDLTSRRFEPEDVASLLAQVVMSRQAITQCESSLATLKAQLAALKHCHCAIALVRQGMRTVRVKNCTHAKEAAQTQLQINEIQATLAKNRRALTALLAQSDWPVADVTVPHAVTAIK